MKSAFLSKRNNRIFLFQYILSNSFCETSFEQLKDVFWFDADKIEEDKVQELVELYDVKKNEIEEEIKEQKQQDKVTDAIIRLGLLLNKSNEDKKLIISECLKISDLFCANSKFINAVLEKLIA